MTYSVVINSGSVLLMSKALSPAALQDSLDTVLFAQLTAEEDFPNGHAHAKWAEVFVETLAACGWQFHDQGATSGMFPRSGVTIFSVYDAVHAAFQSRLSAQQVLLMGSALRMIAQLPVQSLGAGVFREQSILESGTHSVGIEDNLKRTHRVRVLAGIVEADGFLTLATVFFETDQPIEGQFIGQDFALNRVEGGVMTSFLHARFAVNEYTAFREDTVRWLGPQRQALCIKVGEHAVQLAQGGRAKAPDTPSPR